MSAAGEIHVLAWSGEVIDEIDALIEAGGTMLVLNLRLMTFIETSQLGYLVKIAKQLDGIGGELVISEPSIFFRAKVKTLGLGQMFKVFRTDVEAVQYFRGA